MKPLEAFIVGIVATFVVFIAVSAVLLWRDRTKFRGRPLVYGPLVGVARDGEVTRAILWTPATVTPMTVAGTRMLSKQLADMATFVEERNKARGVDDNAIEQQGVDDAIMRMLSAVASVTARITE